MRTHAPPILCRHEWKDHASQACRAPHSLCILAPLSSLLMNQLGEKLASRSCLMSDHDVMRAARSKLLYPIHFYSQGAGSSKSDASVKKKQSEVRRCRCTDNASLRCKNAVYHTKNVARNRHTSPGVITHSIRAKLQTSIYIYIYVCSETRGNIFIKKKKNALLVGEFQQSKMDHHY